MLTVIFTTLLMLNSASVTTVETDGARYIGPPTAEAETLELDDKREALDGGTEKICLACGE
ncbi:MAG: hypothetical protein JOZ96_00470 [Acidobacteria bacterium]|nr:hypothetical protein [Acidobacteriota bacterium]